jgi:2-iminobutanoate/2-iminopropanoate deaminase
MTQRSAAREVFHTDRAPAPVAAYSQACASGPILSVAGQVGIDPRTGGIVEGGAGPQTEQALRNLDAVLTAGGAAIDDVIRMDCYLTTADHLAAFNEVYARWFPAPAPPARTTVFVGLADGLLVELTALAVRRD